MIDLYMYLIRIFLLWLGMRQKALAVFMIGGPIRGKALRGINEGGIGRREMCLWSVGPYGRNAS